MKSLNLMTTVFALAIVSASSAFADGTLTCKTAPAAYGGGTTITVSETDSGNAVIQGWINGGIAQYVREITPVNVTIEHEADATIYSNSDTGLELEVVATVIDGRVVTSASFREGTEFPSVPMTCHAQ